MSTLRNVVVAAEKEDVARGIRVLLRTPLVTARSDPESFDLLRRRAVPIAHWFDYYCGWTLTAEPRLGYVRLGKIGAGEGRDASRPARRDRSTRAPFDRRRYTLLCIVAAELLSTPVTTIGILADRVVQACATEDGIPDFDTASRSERSAFADVIRLLEAMSILTCVDGTTDAFVDARDAKVLYDVDNALLARLLVTATGASQSSVPVEDIAPRFEELIGQLLTEPRYGEQDSDSAPAGSRATEVQRNLWLRHSILRRLFDDPVLHRADLTNPQRDYLASPSGRRLLRDAVELAGFELEERAEGWLLIDRDAVATDSRFPDASNTAKTAALLLVDRLLDTPDGFSMPELVAVVEKLLAATPSWALSYRSDDGPRALARDAGEVLCQFGLATWSEFRIRALPAAARYRDAARSTRGGTR
jgi:uncharacterized protein (TIGR02678 family)